MHQNRSKSTTMVSKANIAYSKFKSIGLLCQQHQQHQRKNSNSRSLALINAGCKTSTMIVSLLIVTLTITIRSQVSCSPPIDYFVYTSQLASALPETQNVTSFLAPIEAIYRHQTSPNANNTLSDKVFALVSNGSKHQHDNNLIDLETAQFAWNLMERQALLYMRNQIHTLRPFIMELMSEADVSPECLKSVTNWLDELVLLKKWAVRMWNSWGQFPPAGLFEGSFTDLGSYRGCMAIDDRDARKQVHEPLAKDSSEDFGQELENAIGQAQYCMLDFQPLIPTRPRFHSIFKHILGHDKQMQRLNNGDYAALKRLTSQESSHGISSDRFKKLTKRLESKANQLNQSQSNQATGNNDNDGLNATLTSETLIELVRKAQYFYYVKFRIGACLPARCSVEDVEKLAQAAGQRVILQSVQVNCMKEEERTLNTYQRVAIWILTILVLVAICGTLVDLLGYKEQRDSSSLANWLLAFSIWTNTKRLFALEPAGIHTDLECIHGLRFFSMLWVIYGHTILYTEYQTFTHFYDVIETQIPSLLLLPSLNANFSVDTFFVISGLLTTYVTWEITKGDARKFNRFAFLISRYIRLTPQLAIVILCFFLLPLFGSGPMYRFISEDKAEVCYNNWLINLLYLQTYIRAEKLCIDPSWWLSIEMTFHFVSLIVIIVMIKNVKQGMIVNALIAAVLTIWGSIIHYQNGFAIQYLPSIPQRYEVASEQTKWFFHRPYPHAASYFIGVALGYVLANKTVKKLTQSQIYQGWTVCALGLIISLWGSYYWNLGAPYTQLQATVYYNLCQVLWPISISWIILVCSLGHGGIVGTILSARCFVPLGRVTYMTYLSHAIIIYHYSASTNIPVEPSMLLFTYLFVANSFLAIVLGILLTVVYESPILNLQKHMFAYLTAKFDPTLKEKQSALAMTNKGRHIERESHHEKRNGFNPSSCVLLLDSNNSANGTTKTNDVNDSPGANCNGIANNLAKG